MVRRVQIVLDDDDFERLKEMKGDLSWRRFLINDKLKEGEGNERKEKS